MMVVLPAPERIDYQYMWRTDGPVVKYDGRNVRLVHVEVTEFPGSVETPPVRVWGIVLTAGGNPDRRHSGPIDVHGSPEFNDALRTAHVERKATA